MVVCAIPVHEVSCPTSTRAQTGNQRLTIQITLTTLCDASPTLVLVVLEHADLLKRLHNLPIDTAAGVDMV